MPSFLTLVLPTHPPWSAQGYTSLIPKREGEGSKSHAGLDSSSSKGKHKHKHKKVLNTTRGLPHTNGPRSPQRHHLPSTNLSTNLSPNPAVLAQQRAPAVWLGRPRKHSLKT